MSTIRLTAALCQNSFYYPLSHLPGKFELQIIRYEIGVALSPLLCIVRASTMQEYFFISALNVGESQLRLG